LKESILFHMFGAPNAQRPLSPRLVALFRDYAEAHRHETNVWLHKIAIPLIVFHTVAMADWIPLARLPGTGVRVTAAHLAYFLVVAWYVRLDVHLGLRMAALFAPCFPLGWLTPRPLVIAVAIAAWTAQLAGHSVWEKRRPAFLRNLAHALVGPAYFVATALGRWPPRDSA
jgi:uncharacterized membrane protein YGL010W